MAPPTWKNGTLIMLIVGGLSTLKGVATPVIRALSCPWVMPMAFGSPVVPLVNRTSASRSSMFSATGGVFVFPSVKRFAAVNTSDKPASTSRPTYDTPQHRPRRTRRS
jgi:hypothetical protein